MRIFFPIAAFYPSQIGGPCNTIYWHTSELVKHGIEVDIITTTVGIENGIVKCDFFHDNESGTVYYGKGNEKKFKTIKHILNKVKTSDIIHLNSLFSFFSIVVFFSKYFFQNKKIIWSVRGELNDKALIYSKWKKQFILFFYKNNYKNIIFHSTSDQETNDINKNFTNCQVFQIPNLIRPAARIHNPTSKKELLYVGRIHPIKSIHKIIEGLSLSKEFLKSEFKFILVGKQEERHNYYFEDLKKIIIEKKLENKIIFKGHLVGEEKELIYAESYATLLMSETENFGNVVLESLNQGTPVIASTGTPWSILESFNCGYHISNDPVNIAKVIDELLNIDDLDYINLRKNAIQLVEKEFDVKNQIFQWIKFYSEFMINN